MVIQQLKDKEQQAQRARSIIQGMARFFWFTVEFGLIRSGKELRAYGSGLLSSYGELEHSLVSPEVQRYPVQLEWAINQSFEIHHYQPLLFIIDSFDHLFSLVDQLERWVKDGKLDNVAPGDPEVSQTDIDSFLQANR
jgi:phenylalanine-4-hydroxylase